MQSLEHLLAQLRTPLSSGTRFHSALTLPSTAAPCQPFPESFPAWLVTLLRAQGVEHLAEHQWQALNHLRQGHHVCLMAPGGRMVFRTLAMYQDSTLAERGHALCIFPHKDRQIAQVQTFSAWNASLAGEHRLDSVVYDGDTPRTQRLAIRQSLPTLVLTTPEMLHAGILPYHSGWRAFLQALRYIVLADVHRYSSALLTHMAHILRRLQRVTQHYGSRPQYLLTSAPVANMAEIARGLTAQPCLVVSGTAYAARTQSRIVIESTSEPVTLCRELITQQQAAGLQPLLLMPATLLARLAAFHADPSWAICSPPVTAEAYHSAELRLLRGECTALLLPHQTPSAAIRPLALSSIIFFGLPPSLMHMHLYLSLLASTHPQSISTLVLSGNTPIERSLLHDPALYQSAWTPVLPFLLRNTQIAKQHLHCATAEMAFRTGESYPGFPDVEDMFHQLTVQKAVTYRTTAQAWILLEPRPHRYVRLRTYEPAWTMVHATDEQFLARVTPVRAFRECFPGAIYRDDDRTLHVERVLPDRRRILAKPIHANYVTRGLIATAVREKMVTASVTEDTFHIQHGTVEYTEKLSAYERLDPYSQQRKSVHLFAESQRQFRTHGTWMTFAETAALSLPDLQTAAHTVVHAVLAGFPLLALHHQDNIQGGVYHTDNAAAVDVIFMDTQPQGNGLSKALYDQYEQILRIGLQILWQCDCTHGCQACIASTQCNTCTTTIPYDRQQGMSLLQRLLGEVVPDFANVPIPACGGGRGKPTAPRCLYLSLTTRKSVEDVGGWQHKHLLGLGVAVTYDTADKRYRMYTADTADDLFACLQAADMIIGFNTRDFDYQILQPYTASALTTLPTLAILDEIHQVLGFRLSFRHVLKETLDIDRPDDSIQNLQWYQEGERERIAQLCRRDIDMLRHLIDYGNTHGVLCYRDQLGTRHAFPVSWQTRTHYG